MNEPRSFPSDTSDPAWLDPEETVPPAETVEVDVPSSGWAQAGSLPVSVGRPADGVAPSRVRVRMLSQSEVAAAGGRFLGFEVTRADGGPTAASVAVALDYSGIANAFGGNFGSRLRLVKGSGCAPDAPCSRPVVAAENAASAGLLRARTLAVPSDRAAATGPEPGSGFGPQSGDPDLVLSSATSGTYTLMSGASGESGNYAATPLSASESWNVGVGSGAFTYSYPVTVPPAPAGPAPALSLDYNSQAVDGRNSVENGQPSQVGEGWSFNTGFIERKFHSCREENIARDDLCWSANNEYFISFQGQSGELVRTSASSNEWRVRGNDPGWRVLSFKACCSNGDNDGEYFVLITPDGTKYWFGYGIEPRNTSSNPYTESAWTVPVYGGSGEPCYNAVALASWCQQAWRWNVDRILDTNDNVTTMFYDKEQNRYSRHMTTTLSTQYDRGGYLTWIEYGQRHLAENGTAYARVEVTTGERCVTQVNCPTPTPTSSPTSYPDVPLDRWCNSATQCAADQTAPTFWSTKAYKSILTEITDVSPARYETVSIYRMSYSFPPTGNANSSPSLWLTDIEHTGEWGLGSTALPAVRMAGVALQNRVNVPTGGDPIYKYRITSISTELGARVEATYGTPDPCPSPTHPAWDTNSYDCYPVRLNGLWSPFHKYLVTDLKAVDVRGGGPDRDVHYTYVGAPAWHYADSVLAQQDNAPQSWSDYRGYEDVRVNVAGGGASEGSDTRYLLFRGMHGDKKENGTTKTDSLTDSRGETWNDYDYRNGRTLEVKTYDATDGHVASKLYRYWSQETVNGPNGFQSHDAAYVRPSQVFERTKNLDTGAWRDRLVNHTYDATTAAPLTTYDQGQPGVTDETCTKQAYTHNTTTGAAGGDTEWIVNRPYWTITYDGDCASTTIIARNSIYYDNQAFQAAPVAGNVTQVSAYITATSAAVTKTRYDALGRVTSVISPGEVAAGTNGATTMTYNPSTGYPANGVETTNVLGHTTTTVYYSGFGTPRRVIDANADVTEVTVDHLGRTTEVSRPGDTEGARTHKFEYLVQAGSHNKVTSWQLVDGSTYVKSYAYYDGLGRLIQTHAPDPNGVAGQSLITMTRYDTLGQRAAETQPFGFGDPAGTGLRTVALAKIPFETRYGYDESGREYVATQYAAGVSQSSNPTHHHGWHHVVDAPVHSDVDYHTDVYGRVTKVVERPATGTITTDYAYSRLGDLAKITDQADNLTTYEYDWLRRRTRSSDPDQGVWTATYTPDGDVDTSTDAKLATLTYRYDGLRRRTEVYDGTTAGPLLSRWRYDTATGGGAVPNAIGRLTESTSYVDGVSGTAYTVKVTGYDNRGRLSGKQWTVPGFPSVSHGYGYNLADQLTTTTYPDVAGLPAETVGVERNAAGLTTRLTTSYEPLLPYVASTTYRPDGRLAGRTLRGDVTRSFTYDTVAGRLATVSSVAPLQGSGDPAAIEDLAYGYDADSNVTSVTDGIAGSGGVAQRECFEYDPLNRLAKAYTHSACTTNPPVPATHGTDPYHLTFAYDALGNITSRVSNGAAAITYDYTATGSRPHAPAVIDGKAYTYDANGATTQRPHGTGTQTLGWDKLHRLASVRGPDAADFVYDADGNRLLRTVDTTTTLYLDDTEITATPDDSGGTRYSAVRYYANSAMRTATGTGTGSKVTILLRNRQNSTSLSYDPDADKATYQRYTPFGARRGTAPLDVTERRFLDKTEDATGLVHLGARYYDPGIGRFVSVDPVVVLTAPQSLAGYSYALNNPATLSDPSGLSAIDPSGGPCSKACEKEYEEEGAVYVAAQHEHEQEIRDIYTGEAAKKSIYGQMTQCGNSTQAAVACYKLGIGSGSESSSLLEDVVGVTKEASGYNGIRDCEGLVGCGLEIAMALPWGRFAKGAKGLKALNAADEVGDGLRALTAAERVTLKDALRPQNLDHVFVPKHKLGPLVQKFGSREAAMEQIVRSIGGPLPAAGRFRIAQSIGGQEVVIRGAVVGGIPRIGTVFTP